MILAITRTPAPSLAECALTYLERVRIDYDLALAQHQVYCTALHRGGAQVEVLPALAHLPDSVFVEDTAVLLDEVAVLTTLGSESRRAEAALIEPPLQRFRPVERIAVPGTLEGGDVLRIGKTLYVGRSPRTNAAGIEQLRALVTPYGYAVVPVQVHGCLHLKTGCTALDDRTILINPDWVDAAAFADFTLLPVATDEPFAANVLRLPNVCLMNAAYSQTVAMVVERGLAIKTIDISEFGKAEAGLTCMSLLLSASS